MRKALWYLFAAALIAAVALPVTWDPRDDDFPLSTFPMFAGRRSREATIDHAVAVDSTGVASVLPPEAVANDEVIQAFETIRLALRRGPEATRELCEQIAQRAPRYAGDYARTVLILSDTFDAVAYFDGDRQPLRSEVRATCEVPR